ncbi:E3 ubiquitin-protein ligase rhf2a, variant 2 [Salvia divinorum]|uniref:RING-type E3 ubiquitin transferase n=1 Tax=Salvia divinorum TaxID=28513 RepID=A0ABD1HQQ2_SALDI
MDEENVSEKGLTSAAAFVEGGIQDACDDSCSICLEAFCDSDPSTVTTCKHEFHLQCILEWCQRSSQCPMCWQPIGLKDPSSQELLEGVEHERNIRMNPPRNTTIFHHPTLGDFELQHLPVSASESELEERIIQHLAAAAAMGRARHFARREGQRNRSSAQGRPQFVVFSTHPNGASAASPAAQREGGFPPSVMIAGPNSPFITAEDSDQLIPRILSAQADVHMATGSASNASPTAASRSSSSRSPVQTSPGSHDRAGPSDLHSFSETLKSRFSTLSTRNSRYKESITKTTRGWKEKLFARNSQTPEQQTTPEARRDPSQGIATVSQMMGHLEVSEDSRTTLSRNIEDGSGQVPTSQPATETQAPCAAAGSATN